MKKQTPKATSKTAAGKPARQRDLGPPPEAFEGLDTWAAEVAQCVSKAELGVLVGDYQRTANNKHISAANRRLARLQAKALRKFLVRSS